MIADTHADVAPAGTDDHPVAWPVLFLAGLSVAWLAAILWSAHAIVTGSGGDNLVALDRAVLALPSVVTASLVAGVALGLASIMLVGRESLITRLVTGTGTGVLTGLAVAVLILTGYGTSSSLVVLATWVGVASAI